MKLYRITTPQRAYDLSGTGAKLYGGRWNTPGHYLVYATGTVSLAMLETLVHTDHESLKRSLSLNIINVPDHLHIEKTEVEDLPEEWQNFPFDSCTQQRGDRWLRSRLTPILQVPSAVNPFEYNFLLNPLHPQFHLITVDDVREIRFDMRMVL